MKPRKAQERPGEAVGQAGTLVWRHLQFGWWSLLTFLLLGIFLEAMHGFKVAWYLNISSGTRRLLWTLAHAHGTLLGLIHIIFGLASPGIAGWPAHRRNLASAALIGASIFLPGGFFLGGLILYSHDPGPGILLVPFGAILLFVALFCTARAARTAGQ